MRFHVLTLFPEMFSGPFDHGIAARARESGAIGMSLINIRDYARDRHRTVDDYTFGGGPGMLMKPEPLFDAVEAVRGAAGLDDAVPVILMSPQGRRLTQPVVEELSRNDDLGDRLRALRGVRRAGASPSRGRTRSASATTSSAAASLQRWC